MRRPLDPAYVLDQYEAMRREALGGDPFGCRGHGLALFLSRGMPRPGWLPCRCLIGVKESSMPWRTCTSVALRSFHQRHVRS
jgi:hypothetical protein